MTPLDRIARFERDLVVQAGAGTGKTHALVTLYLHLVAGLTHARRAIAPARIAVVTFTDKAAGELKERVRARLGALAADPSAASESTLVAAAEALGRALPDGRTWADAVAQLGAAPLGTFHAFSGALLRRYAARLGLEPDFALLDEAEAHARATDAAERAILDALDLDPDGDVAQLVGELGYRAVGRGTGLIDHLVRLRAALAEEGRPPSGLDRGYELSAIADDWSSALDSFRFGLRRLGALGSELSGKSAVLARELAARAPDLRADAAAVLDGARALVGELKNLRGDNPALPDAKDTLRQAEERLREAHASRRAAPLARGLARLVETVEARYAADKRRDGVVDFADLLVRARDLLRDHEDARQATRERFDALLVDEFQDTNPVQGELVELIAGEPGAPGRRFVVGDRKQSIYEFRGADVAVFTRAARSLLDRGGAEELLRQSRRSAPSLLRLNNALFTRVMAGGGADEWELSFAPERDDLLPWRSDEPGAGGELITVTADSSAAERALEARAIATRLLELRAAGRPWGDVAILLRRFTHLVDYLDALRAAQVPYFVVRGRGFFSAQEVRDLTSALTLLDDPDDRLALVAVLRSPLCGLSDESLARLAFERHLKTGALFDESGGAAATLPADEAARLASFRVVFRELRLQADRLGPSACLRSLIDRCDLEAILITTRDGEQRVANLERLVERARAFEAGGGDLRGFVAWLRRAAAGAEGDVAQAQIVDERDDVVRVMTVHQAKGLEFPVVFVPACGSPERRDNSPVVYQADVGLGLRIEDDQVPGLRVHTGPSRRAQATRDARQRAESLRLFYVAATRARDLVIFSGERMQGGADSWRAHLDALAEDPATAPLLRVVDGQALAARPLAPLPEGAPDGDEESARRRLRAITDRPPPAPEDLTAAVTQLADFQLCPRRYHQFHALGLLEHPAAARAASSEPVLDVSGGDDTALALDPLRRGTLAHRLLERCDFARRGQDLDALLAADGYDPTDPAVAEVRAHAVRFLGTDFARRAAGAAFRRELPFLFSVPLDRGGRLFVRGQIDLLLLELDGVTVVDYKHARAGDPDDYRFQLDAYALAARRLYPRAPSVRVGLAFLKERDPSPRLASAPDFTAFERQLAELGRGLADARGRDDWEGRPVEYCRRLRCGYLYRCHAEAAR